MGPSGHPDPEISEEGRGGGGGLLVSKKIFWALSGLKFGLKIRGEGHPGLSPESTTDLNVVG